MSFIFLSLISGTIATLVMDIWAYAQKRLFKVPSLDYCLVGRWISTMPKGQLKHSNIVQSPPEKNECITGWFFHYLIGVIYAGSYLILCELLSLPVGFISAIAFGLLTVVVPFFIMQPGLGFGIAASNTPNPAQTRVRSLVAHFSFGIGLFLGVWFIQ